MKNRKNVSIILPCYNEEDIIENTVLKCLEFAKVYKECEFIFVSDGSTDKTYDILVDLKLKLDNTTCIKVIGYKNNKGKGYAVKYGINHCEGEYICFVDSDLAYSLNGHIPQIVELLRKFGGVVIGNRGLVLNNKKNVSFLRILFGRVFNLCMKVILGLKYNDVQAGLKGANSDIFKDLFNSLTIEDWAFDSELIFIAKKRGYEICEIPARVSKSHLNKTSKISLISDSIKMFLSLIKIRINSWLGRYNEK